MTVILCVLCGSAVKNIMNDRIVIDNANVGFHQNLRTTSRLQNSSFNAIIAVCTVNIYPSNSKTDDEILDDAKVLFGCQR